MRSMNWLKQVLYQLEIRLAIILFFAAQSCNDNVHDLILDSDVLVFLESQSL